MKINEFNAAVGRLASQFVERLHKHDVAGQEYLANYYDAFESVTVDDVEVDPTNVDGFSLLVDNLDGGEETLLLVGMTVYFDPDGQEEPKAGQICVIG